MTDCRDFKDFTPLKPDETRAGRAPDGRFAPGNGLGRLGGRPSKAQEIAHAEAARRGCTAEDFEKVIAKMRDLALGGNVQAGSLLVRTFGLGREEAGAGQQDVGEGLAGLLSRPGATEKISALMDELFATDEKGAAR